MIDLSWVLAIIFMLEFFLLFFFSRFMTRYLFRLTYFLTKSKSFSVNFLAILFLPGTIVHEISHFLIAGMLFVPVGEIEIFPQVEGDGIRLGSAEIAQTDMLRRMIIGMAPIIVGLAIIFGVLFLGQNIISFTAPLWQIALVLYFIFEVSNSMFSSKKDLEGAAAFFGAIIVVLILVLGLLYFTDLLPSQNFLSNLNLTGLSNFFQKVDIFLLIPLILDLLIITFTKFLLSFFRE